MKGRINFCLTETNKKGRPERGREVDEGKILYFIHVYINSCKLGVDRLSAPILSILPIINIGHFQNRFADNFYFFIFFIMQTNILFTGDIIYWWLINTGEIIQCLNALFGSMQPVWAQHSVRVRRSLNLWEQSPPTAHLICRESRVRPINAENWRQSHTESTCLTGAASVITHQLSLKGKAAADVAEVAINHNPLWCPRCGKCGRNRGMQSYNGIYRITRNVAKCVEVWMN